MLSRTVGDLVGPLDRRLRAGASLRVVIIDPDSSAPVEAVARTFRVTSPDGRWYGFFVNQFDTSSTRRTR